MKYYKYIIYNKNINFNPTDLSYLFAEETKQL